VIQTVYVLEIVRAGGGIGNQYIRSHSYIRSHFAQTLGAAQRAASGKYGLSGHWEQVQHGGLVVARLLGEQDRELARVVKELLIRS
jgi:hypothetical protein